MVYKFPRARRKHSYTVNIYYHPHTIIRLRWHPKFKGFAATKIIVKKMYMFNIRMCYNFRTPYQPPLEVDGDNLLSYCRFFVQLKSIS